MIRRFVVILFVLGSILGPWSAVNSREQIAISEAQREDGRITFDIATPGGPLLTGADLTVQVNGEESEGVIATVKSSYEAQAGVVLLIDTSGSMQGRPIADAKRAISNFIGEIGGGTKVALVPFSSEAQVASGFTADRGHILQAVSALEATGETALFDGVVRAVELLEARPPEQRNIVLLTDGADTVSKNTLPGALRAARGADARVFGVALKSEDFSSRSIQALTNKTGGRLLQTTDSSELSGLFEDLARTLVTGYSVSVTDTDPEASNIELVVAVEQGDAVMTGTGSFKLEVPSDETPAAAGAELPELPLPLLLFGVFAVAAIVAFLVLEWLRAKRRSKVTQQLAWYTNDGTVEVDSDALINAAVLQRAQTLATDFARRTGYFEKVEREIEAAGMTWRVGEALVTSIMIGVTAFVVGLLLGSFLLALFLGAIGSTSLFLVVKFKAARRRRAFGEQLPDVLLLMGGALKAGYSLQQAASAVGEDARAPASEEFRRAMAEVRLGSSLDDALGALGARVRIVDFDWTVLAIQIQREVGGNLAEVLQNISDTIRERQRLNRQIKTLTAEARLSALILGTLPFAMAGFLFISNRQYLVPLVTTSLGLMMIGGAAFMMSIGFLWMRKLIRIEV
ncbi:MAG: type II secretion system F family protein [Actinomycetota bacterium]|nr:type II secretion system F family protein [Actinomycetota bacterium]